MTVELHEDGPDWTFFITHASEIAAYVGALATLISTWVNVRLSYRKANPKPWEKEGIRVEVGDVVLSVSHDIEPERLKTILTSLSEIAEETQDDA
jgi:hypothetical protein